MQASELYDLREILTARRVVFAYSGFMTEQVLGGVGAALRQKLRIEDIDTQTMRSVFAIFVEQMQNIIRYSAESLLPNEIDVDVPPGEELRFGLLTIGYDGDKYAVHSGNVVWTVDVARLRDMLVWINAQDRAGLKAAYKARLKSEPDDTSKGAGVGFIEIARRATHPIEYDFMPIDDKRAYFALKATI